MTLYDQLVAEIRREFPRFRIIPKPESRFMRAIDRFLRVVTFGAQDEFLSEYQTTIGYRLYVTPDWDELPVERRYVTLRHERVHLRQFRRYTFVGMTLLYVFLPLPMGLAWFRTVFEREAYEESMRAAAEVYGLDFVRGEMREKIIDRFTSGAYGWMWPFPRSMNRWYDRILKEIEGHEDRRAGA